MHNYNLPNELSKTAYGGIEGEKYIPYVKDKKNFTEGTFGSIFLGVLLAILFAGANTYLGLTAGMTIAAGIPGAILGSGLLLLLFRRKSILEGNVMQGMSSAGETIASGIIFVVPAMFITGAIFSPYQAIIASIAGVLIGTSVMILVRRYLVIRSHGDLIYPESMAISEVLVASNSAGDGLKTLATGGAIGGFIKVLSSDVFSFFNSSPMYVSTAVKSQIGFAVAPALIGVGYIVGIEVGLAMAAGTVLANMAIMPLFGMFGMLDQNLVLFPSTIPLAEMSPSAISSRYIRYIGAGAIATGGLITLIRIMPTIFVSIKKALSNISVTTSENFDPDLSLKIAILFAVVAFLVIVFIPGNLFLGVISAILVVLCSFLFAIVSARMTGIVGTSNLPVSGMTIASLLIVTPTFVLLGYTDVSMVGVLVLLGTAIVTAISIGGGFSQTLKTTYIIGGTTKTIQKSFIFASIIGAIFVVFLIYILNEAYGFTGEGTRLIAPQANLISMIITGIIQGDLPWVLILSGSSIAVALALLRLPVMSIAIGFYLPIATVFAIVIGGILRIIVEKKYKNNESERESKITRGTILAAGLVAGEAIIGLIAAIITVILGNPDSMMKIGKSIVGESLSNSPMIGILVMIALLSLVYSIINKTKKI